MSVFCQIAVWTGVVIFFHTCRWHRFASNTSQYRSGLTSCYSASVLLIVNTVCFPTRLTQIKIELHFWQIERDCQDCVTYLLTFRVTLITTTEVCKCPSELCQRVNLMCFTSVKYLWLSFAFVFALSTFLADKQVAK